MQASTTGLCLPAAVGLRRRHVPNVRYVPKLPSPNSLPLFDNTARSGGGAPREIQMRHIRHCMKADPAYGAGVAKALGIPVDEVTKNG